MRERIVKALILMLILALCMATPSLAAEQSGIGLDTFEEILDNIQKYQINSPDSGTLIHTAIDGMLESLNDPHTQYLSPAELKEFEELLEANYVGIGIQLEKGQQFPRVSKVYEDTPAWKAGIQPGDLIIKLDGTDTSQMSLDQIVQKMRGKDGTSVDLTIRRESRGDFEIQVVRATIIIPTVSTEMLDNDIGYIRIEMFGESTADEFRTRLGGLLLQGAHRLILDLRDNPGGLVNSVAAVTGNFVEPGTSVVSLRERDGQVTSYPAVGMPIAQGIPVIALVNGNSASAAEIMAGDLQDFGIAKLIGSRTYGKGTAQVGIPLKEGGALIVTIAQFYTPKGRFIDGVGLEPDIQVLTPDLVTVAARRQLEPPAAISVLFQIGLNNAMVDGISVPLTEKLQQIGGEYYLPARFTLEALGYQVFWQSYNNSIRISDLKTDTVLKLGQEIISENGFSYIPVSKLSSLGINIKVEGQKMLLERSWQ